SSSTGPVRRPPSPQSRKSMAFAPRAAAAASASACRPSGVPRVPRSPRVRWRIPTDRPSLARRASVPPQPSSTSSGWAPIASTSSFIVSSLQRTSRTSWHDHLQVRGVQLHLRPQALGELRAIFSRKMGGRDDPLLRLAQRQAGLAELVGAAVDHLVLARRGGRRLFAEDLEGMEDLLPRLLERPLQVGIG